MYMPFEQAYFAVIKQEPNILAEALGYNVAVVTNSTLLATLRTVSHVWRLSDQQKNAEEIASRGAALYEKFVGFIDDLESVGDALETSRNKYKAAWNKLVDGKGNLVRQAEMLRELGVKPGKELPEGVVEQASQEDEKNLPNTIAV
jgi:DNA recombination protein RmuC